MIGLGSAPTSVTPSSGDVAASAERSYHRLLVLLGAVAVAWIVAQLLVTFRVRPGWDETIYLTQYARGVPPDAWHAQRARGVALLVAPVSVFTNSVPVIRSYLSVLSGLLLFGAYWPWLRLRTSAVVPLAAALFASTWVAFFYANEAMPNSFVAYGAVAATALLVHAAWPGRRRAATAGLFAILAAVSLIRPTDGLWVAVALVGAALLVRRWRRPASIIAVMAGLAVGWVEWFAEAYAYYGGPLERLRLAGQTNQTGLHFSLYQHLSALSNRHFVCLPACHGISPLPTAWFLAIPLIGAIGVYAAWRKTHFAVIALAAVTSVVVAAGYIVGVGFANPRFLLPYYALVALPVAEALVWLWRLSRPGLRVVAAAVVVVLLLAHLSLQSYDLSSVVQKTIRGRNTLARASRELSERGLRRPCLVYGRSAPQVAYPLLCGSQGVSSTAKKFLAMHHTPYRIRKAVADGERVAVIAPFTKRRAPFLAGWRRVHLTTRRLQRWYVYLSIGRRKS